MNAETKVKAGTAPAVYAAIAAIQGELAKTGIAKTRKNQQGSGYMFRGIDDVYAALSPLLATHGLVVIPRILEREVIERQSKSGGALFYVTVHAEFDFVAVADGSIHTAATYGEAMDSGDKATNKAMSAAYKYAAFMAFAIPTEGDNDADSTTHEVATNGKINEGQFKALQWLMDEKGVTSNRFCRKYQIDAVADLPASKFADAEAALKALKTLEPVQ